MKRMRIHFVQCELNKINHTTLPKMHDAVIDFIEQMGLVAEEDGLSRIAGRMIGYLLVDDRVHSLDNIADQLQVSKGSVSTNARLLERFGIIERHSVPGDRRDYYRISNDPWMKVSERLQQRMWRTLQVFERGLEQIPAELVDTRRRLELWQSFYLFLLKDFENTIQRWEEWRAEQGMRVEN